MSHLDDLRKYEQLLEAAIRAKKKYLHLGAFKEFLCILDIPYGATEDIYNGCQCLRIAGPVMRSLLVIIPEVNALIAEIYL